MKAILLALTMLGFLSTLSPAQADDEDCAVQTELRKRSYYTGEIDCDIGPATRAAIVAFQSDSGLPMTGEVGPRTKDRLFGNDYEPEGEHYRYGHREHGNGYGDREYTHSDRCYHRRVSVTYELLDEGTTNLIKAWETQVYRDGGIRFADWRLAEDKAQECKTYVAGNRFLNRCTISARPCRWPSKQGDGGH